MTTTDRQRTPPGVTPWLVGSATVLGATALIGVLSSHDTAAGRVPLLLTAAAGSLLVVIASLLRARKHPPAIDTFGLFLIISVLHLVLVPILNVFFGPPELPNRPNAATDGAADAALLSLALAFFICVGALARKSTRPSPEQAVSREPAPETPRGVIGLLIALGLLGVVIRFPSPGAMAGFLRGDYQEITRELEGFVGLASSVTRPMLALGTFLLFRQAKTIGVRLMLVPAVVLSLLTLLSFSLNRASLLVTLLAMLLVHLRDQGQGAMKRLILLGAVGVGAFMVIGTFRTELFVTEGGRYEVATEQTSPIEDLYSTVSVYGQSPFMAGVLYDDGSPGLDVAPSGVLASIASPIPKLGEDFRDASGTAIYNKDIYGTVETQDQILPVWAELHGAFGPIALLLGGLVIGWLIAALDDRIARARSMVATYALTLLGVWLAQANIVSVAILAQIIVYFVVPPLLLATWVDRRHRTPAPDRAESPVPVHSAV